MKKGVGTKKIAAKNTVITGGRLRSKSAQNHLRHSAWIVSTCLTTALLAVSWLVNYYHVNLHLHWQWAALPHVAGLMLIMAITAYVIRKHSGRPVPSQLLCMLCSVFVWVFAILLMTISTTANTALFWHKIAELAMCFLGLFCLLFILNYVDQGRTLHRPPILLSVGAAQMAVFWTILDAAGVQTFRFTPGWGYYQTALPDKSSVAIELLWFYMLGVIGFILLSRYRHRLPGDHRRQQLTIALSTGFLLIICSGLLAIPGASIIPPLRFVVLLGCLSGITLLAFTVAEHPSPIAPVPARSLSDAYIHTAVERLQSGLIIIGLHGDVMYRNEAAQQILGTPRGGWWLSGLAALLGDNVNLRQHHLEAQKKAVAPLTKITTVGDKILSVYTSSAPYIDGSHSTILLIQDITAAQLLARSKDEFFSIASHELRTPLTAIRGNASMIMQFYAEALKDQQLHDMVYDIHESSTRLIDIVNDFLDVSRLEQGKLAFNYGETALEEVIENVMYEMRAVLKEKNLSLEFNHKTIGNLPKVWVDKNRLKQIIYNLVGNAAKFTAKGGISLHATAQGTFIKVLVSDTGPGISKGDQELLFRKFQQVGDNRLSRDTTHGTGLGLYISKMLVEHMGGRITLESSHAGRGSTFSFTVPIAGKLGEAAPATDTQKNTAVSAPRPAAATVKHESDAIHAAAPGYRRYKLLIVEDDPYVQRLYARVFTSRNITVSAAVNGEEGLKLARHDQPDMILLDVMMPVMNGLEVLTALKARSDTKHIPVIMLSSFDETETVQTALVNGAIDYLSKSAYDPLRVRELVEQHLFGEE